MEKNTETIFHKMLECILEEFIQRGRIESYKRGVLDKRRYHLVVKGLKKKIAIFCFYAKREQRSLFDLQDARSFFELNASVFSFQQGVIPIAYGNEFRGEHQNELLRYMVDNVKSYIKGFTLEEKFFNDFEGLIGLTSLKSIRHTKKSEEIYGKGDFVLTLDTGKRIFVDIKSSDSYHYRFFDNMLRGNKIRKRGVHIIIPLNYQKCLDFCIDPRFILKYLKIFQKDKERINFKTFAQRREKQLYIHKK